MRPATKTPATRRPPLPLALALPAAVLLASPACGDDKDTSASSTEGAAVCTPGQTEACYSGDATTKGVGACKAGERTCDADGKAWSACQGEITPIEEACDGADNNCDGQVDEGDPGGGAACMTGAVGACGVGSMACSSGKPECAMTTLPSAEKCDTPADENCDGIGPCDGKNIWSTDAGDQLGQGGQSVAVDSAGNIVVAGYFDGTIDLGGGPLKSDGATDVFVEKVDPAGKHLWSMRCGGLLNQSVSGVAVDSMSNVLAVGSFEGDLGCGGDAGKVQSGGSSDVFAAKLDAAGAPVWIKRFGDPSEQRAAGVAVDGQGNAVLAGYFVGSVNFGDAPLASAGGQDIFVAKLDPAGAPVFSRGFGAPGPQYAMAVASDLAGNTVIAGCFQGSLDFGDGALMSAGSDDAFVVKLDPTGNTVWSRRFGGVEFECGSGVAMDAAGNTTVLGHFSGAVDFGSGPLTSMGTQDLFVVRLDAAGGTVWSRRFGQGTAYGYGLAVDSAGQAALTGQFTGSIDFGAGALSDTGNGAIFVAKLDASGKGVWSKRFGSSGVAESAVGLGIAVDALGYVIATGWFSGTMDVDGTTLSNDGATDFFLSRFAP